MTFRGLVGNSFYSRVRNCFNVWIFDTWIWILLVRLLKCNSKMLAKGGTVLFLKNQEAFVKSPVHFIVCWIDYFVSMEMNNFNDLLYFWLNNRDSFPFSFNVYYLAPIVTIDTKINSQVFVSRWDSINYLSVLPFTGEEIPRGRIAKFLVQLEIEFKPVNLSCGGTFEVIIIVLC